MPARGLNAHIKYRRRAKEGVSSFRIRRRIKEMEPEKAIKLTAKTNGPISVAPEIVMTERRFGAMTSQTITGDHEFDLRGEHWPWRAVASE